MVDQELIEADEFVLIEVCLLHEVRQVLIFFLVSLSFILFAIFCFLDILSVHPSQVPRVEKAIVVIIVFFKDFPQLFFPFKIICLMLFLSFCLTHWSPFLFLGLADPHLIL
jgi:hypothetical protein